MADLEPEVPIRDHAKAFEKGEKQKKTFSQLPGTPTELTERATQNVISCNPIVRCANGVLTIVIIGNLGLKCDSSLVTRIAYLAVSSLTVENEKCRLRWFYHMSVIKCVVHIWTRVNQTC